MVVDTSVLLALYFDEAHAEWAATQLTAYDGMLMMSTVNLAECLIHLEDRQPRRFAAIRDQLLGSGIDFVAPNAGHAQTAAAARLRYRLNLGDCFAYALARDRRVQLMTLDGDFLRTDAEVLHPDRG